jgi:two-component system, cell cycle response regulator
MTFALAGLAVLVALVGSLAPGVAETVELPWLAQGAADVAAGALCVAVARRTSGASRCFWSLVAAWMWLYGAAALTFGLGLLAGWGAPAAGDLDALWVPAYLPLVAALLVLYRALLGRWAWGGLLESFAISCAVGLFAWDMIVVPLGPAERGLLENAAGLAVFAGLDLFCVFLAVWLVVRRGLRPRWIAALLGALLAQALSDVLYLRASAIGEVPGAWSASSLAVLSAALVAAMAARRLAGERALGQGPLGRRAFWAQMLPLPVCFAAGVMAVMRPGERHLGLLALVALMLLMGRLVIAARRTEHLALENARLARTDPLTGAENRRVLDEELERALSLAERSGRPVAVVAIDLDRFKAVNDHLGHAAGDRLLIVAAEAMRSCLRASDRLYRVGGDEFLVLAPDSGAGDALMLAERLVEAIAEVGEQWATGLDLGASAGVAAYPEDAPGTAPLLQSADRALYAAKAAGSGRARTAS